MHLIVQPEGSGVCGQCCVAMAAGVSLKRACDAVGHNKASGTHTREIVRALTALGLTCDSRLRRISRSRPNLPKRAIVAIHRPYVEKKRNARWHWMLTWDGKIYDPGDSWPDRYEGWKITSYLEIYA